MQERGFVGQRERREADFVGQRGRRRSNIKILQMSFLFPCQRKSKFSSKAVDRMAPKVTFVTLC